jgi:nudix motif 8
MNLHMKAVSTATNLGNMFSVAHKLQCCSLLHKPGSPVTKPQWRLPGTKKIVDVKMAAVLVPLCFINNQPSVLLTLRSSRLLGHQGEVSFPGGMTDVNDTDMSHTALREAFEEIGLLPHSVDLWGQMGLLPSRNYEIAITPVIGFCGEIDMTSLKLNHSEVEEVFSATVSSLCDSNNIGCTRFRGNVVDYTLPVFLGQKHRIWGITSIILHEVLKLLIPDSYTFTYKMY